MIRSQLLC